MQIACNNAANQCHSKSSSSVAEMSAATVNRRVVSDLFQMSKIHGWEGCEQGSAPRRASATSQVPGRFSFSGWFCRNLMTTLAFLRRNHRRDVRPEFRDESARRVIYGAEGSAIDEGRGRSNWILRSDRGRYHAYSAILRFTRNLRFSEMEKP